MKKTEIKINYNNVLNAFQKVQSIIQRKEIKPILSNVLLKAKKSQIEITGTNLEISIKELYSAEIIQEGSMVLDAKRGYEIIKEMPEKEISLKRKDNNFIEISTDDILFNLVGLDPDEFPEIDFLENEKFYDINPGILKEMIEKTIYASSNDETRSNLNGILFEKMTINEKEILRLVATDAHRLSMIDKELTEINPKGILGFDELEKGVIFSKKGLLELKKLLDEDTKNDIVHFLCKNNNGIFKKGNCTLIIRIINEEFPNYIQAIPKDTTQEINIPRLKLLNALKRVSIIAEEKSKGINFNFSKNVLKIYASNPIMGEGRETIPIDYKESEFTIGFNARYFIDILTAIKTEQVIFKIKDKDSAVIVSPLNDEAYTCVIMPMEIKE